MGSLVNDCYNVVRPRLCTQIMNYIFFWWNLFTGTGVPSGHTRDAQTSDAHPVSSDLQDIRYLAAERLQIQISDSV